MNRSLTRRTLMLVRRIRKNLEKNWLDPGRKAATSQGSKVLIGRITIEALAVHLSLLEDQLKLVANRERAASQRAIGDRFIASRDVKRSHEKSELQWERIATALIARKTMLSTEEIESLLIECRRVPLKKR